METLLERRTAHCRMALRFLACMKPASTTKRPPCVGAFFLPALRRETNRPRVETRKISVMDIRGRTAVVTGSNSGIGLGIARQLANVGVNLILNSFTESPDDQELADGLAREFGISARYIRADMSRPEDCRALVAEAAACDILVNNAGIQHVAPIEAFPVERWNSIIAINLSAAFHTTAAALPGMRDAGWGRIVNIASVHGVRASPYKSAYIAAKHGIIGLTKTVALETAEDPVTCNAICPGYVLTPLVEAQIPGQMDVHGMDRESVVREVMLARQPSKRFATVEQVGGTTVFLCSEAAAQITGTAINLDGGWTAR